MLAIKRMKDIRSGKKFSSGPPPGPPQEIVAIPCDPGPMEAVSHTIGDFRTFSTGSRDSSYGRQQPNSLPVSYNTNGGQFSPSVFHRSHHPLQQHASPLQHHGSPLHRQHSQHSTSSNNNSSNNNHNITSSLGSNGINSSQPTASFNINGHISQANQQQHPAVQYRPDIVTVHVHPHVRRNKDGVFEEPIYSTFHPDNNRYSQYQQQFVQQQCNQQFSSLPPRPSLPLNGSYPPRSLDDGDVTPTNEIISYEGGGGTLPRHKTSNTKFRPVAKVTAKTRVDVHHEMSHSDPKQNIINAIEDSDLVDDNFKQFSNATKIENIYNMIHSHSTNNTPQGTPKKLPPPPPRRSNSISETSKLDSLSNTHAGKTSMPGNITTSAGNQNGNSVFTSSAVSQHTRDTQYGYLRRSLNYGYMGVKNNLQPDIASDLPPPPPAPHDVGNHQHIHHHHSHRRPQQQLLTEEDAAAQQEHYGAAKEEDFPPPPPPLATSLDAPSEELVLVRPRRNDSTVSNCSHKVCSTVLYCGKTMRIN